jgi:hypothetical protein
MNSERDDLIPIKELREFKNENENYENQTNLLNEKCYAIMGEIEYLKEKLIHTQQEIDYRNNKLIEIKDKFISLNSILKEGEIKIKDKNNLNKIQSDLIKRNLEKIFLENIPEWESCIDKKDKFFDQENHLKEPPFSDLIFDNVIIIIDINEINKSKNVLTLKLIKQSFLISKFSTFKEIKSISCKFFSLSDEDLFIITDIHEAIIYNENMNIEYFFREYSVILNEFKLTRLKTIKEKIKLDNKSEQYLLSSNRINNKKILSDNCHFSGKIEKKFISKFIEFFSDYPRLKNYCLLNGNEKEIRFNDIGNEKYKKKIDTLKYSLETSFMKFIILLIIYFTTVIFILESRSININNETNKYLLSFFDVSKVKDYKSFYNYTISTIGSKLFLEDYDNKINLFNYKQSFFEAFYDLDYKKYLNLNNTYTNKDFYKDLNVTYANNNNEKIDLKNIIIEMNDKMDIDDFIPITDLVYIVSKVDKKNCENRLLAYRNLINDTDKCGDFFHYPKSYTELEIKKMEENINIEILNGFDFNYFIKGPKFINGNTLNNRILVIYLIFEFLKFLKFI